MFIPNLFPSLALDSSTGEKTDAQQFNIRREFSAACNLRLLGLRSSTSLTMRSGLLPRALLVSADGQGLGAGGAALLSPPSTGDSVGLCRWISAAGSRHEACRRSFELCASSSEPTRRPARHSTSEVKLQYAPSAASSGGWPSHLGCTAPLKGQKLPSG